MFPPDVHRFPLRAELNHQIYLRKYLLTWSNVLQQVCKEKETLRTLLGEKHTKLTWETGNKIA